MDFPAPRPPRHTVFPETAHHIANGVMGVLVVAALVYSVLEWRRGRGPLALVLTAGGAVSYLNEPILDVLGLLWHPRPGQDVAITTFGPAPMWGLGIYTVFFGTGTYVLLRVIRNGMTRQQFWLGTVAFWAVNLAVELPLIGAGLYHYYGYHTQPFSIGGLPLYWLFVNAGAPLIAACLILQWPRFFAGWGVLRAVLLPMTIYGGYCLASGWPIFTALHVKSLPQVITWGAALLTMAIGAWTFDTLAKWVASRQVSPAGVPSEPRTPPGSGRLRHAGAPDARVV